MIIIWYIILIIYKIMRNLDSFEISILDALQSDASLAIHEIAERVGLSQNPCWRRIRRLEEEGYITGRVALLDRRRLGCKLTVYVTVRTSRHDDEWLEQFREHASAIPEVVELYRMSGHIDYMLKIVVGDVEAYDAVYRELIRIEGCADVTSSFAMEEMKYTTAIPLPSTPD